MLNSSIYNMLFVLCLWQYAGIFEGRVVDVEREQLSQQVMRHCLQNCSSAKTTPSNVKVSRSHDSRISSGHN